MLQKLECLIEQLHLRGMADSLKSVLAEARHQGQSIEEVLQKLLEIEHQYRNTRRLENRLKAARLSWEWSIDTFPFKTQPAVKKSQIMSLAKLEFVTHLENVIFIGKPGTGKTGLAISLLRLALVNGYRGRFYKAQDLLNELYASLADRSTSSLLKTIANYDIIIIDELGYLTLTSEQINIFFKLIDMRYHKKSTIITTNLDFSAWYDVFKQKELVDAMLDRLNHYCTIIKIDGPSLREPKQSKSQKK